MVDEDKSNEIERIVTKKIQTNWILGDKNSRRRARRFAKKVFDLRHDINKPIFRDGDIELLADGTGRVNVHFKGAFIGTLIVREEPYGLEISSSSWWYRGRLW